MRKKLIFLSLLVGGFPSQSKGDSPKAEEGGLLAAYRAHDYVTVAKLCGQLKELLLPPSAQLLCAEAYAATGQIAAAGKLLRTLLDQNPPGIDRMKIQYDLANLLFMEGRYIESKKIYQDVVATSQERGEWEKKARERIAKIMAKTKEHDWGSKKQVELQFLEIEQRIEKGVDLAESRDILAEMLLLLKGKQAERAAELLEKLRDKRRALITQELSEVNHLYREENNLPAAREILQRILSTYPVMDEREYVEHLFVEIQEKEEIAELKKGRKR